MKICQEENCNRKQYGRGMCQAHYMRWRRKNNPNICLDEDCSGPVYAKGLCEDAYKKYLRENNPDYDTAQTINSNKPKTRQQLDKRNARLRERTKQRNPFGFKKDVVSYQMAHVRLRRLRGVAKDYECVDCGQGADHWSLNREATGTLHGPEPHNKSLMAYSLDINDYSPRCSACHGEYYERGNLDTQIEQNVQKMAFRGYNLR